MPCTFVTLSVNTTVLGPLFQCADYDTTVLSSYFRLQRSVYNCYENKNYQSLRAVPIAATSDRKDCRAQHSQVSACFYLLFEVAMPQAYLCIPLRLLRLENLNVPVVNVNEPPKAVLAV